MATRFWTFSRPHFFRFHLDTTVCCLPFAAHMAALARRSEHEVSIHHTSTTCSQRYLEFRHIVFFARLISPKIGGGGGVGDVGINMEG